jgi:hypothetical protein
LAKRLRRPILSSARTLLLKAKIPMISSAPTHSYVPQTPSREFQFTVLRQTTGALVTDNDAGLCEPAAANTCGGKKKREALPRSPRAGQQARSPKPDNMQTRSMLKKRRLDDQASLLFFFRWSCSLTFTPFRLKPAPAAHFPVAPILPDYFPNIPYQDLIYGRSDRLLLPRSCFPTSGSECFLRRTVVATVFCLACVHFLSNTHLPFCFNVPARSSINRGKLRLNKHVQPETRHTVYTYCQSSPIDHR